MKFDLKSLLKDRNVLYVVLFIAVLNLFGYLMLRDLDAVLFFLALGLLTSYFSKNMIVVMLVAMVGTNLLMTKRHSGKEGFDGDKSSDKEPVTKKQGDRAVKPASETEEEEEATGRKPKLDYASTLEKAYLRAGSNTRKEEGRTRASTIKYIRIYIYIYIYTYIYIYIYIYIQQRKRANLLFLQTL